MSKKIFSITGAFSNTGKYLAETLANTLGENNIIINNFTNNPNRPHDLNIKFPNLEIRTYPLEFEKDKLKKQLEGSVALYNSYWTRFNDFKILRSKVVENHLNLITAAKEVGVQKLVYVSHTQKEDGSSLEIKYINNKKLVEDICKENFKNLLILRPCMIYADHMRDSIVINNLAYLMRRFKIIPMIGNGDYPIHPVHARDLVEEACRYIIKLNGVIVKDAISDKMTYLEMVKKIRESLGITTFIIKNTSEKFIRASQLGINYIMKDKFIELDDLDILTGGHASGKGEVIGKRNLQNWLLEHKNEVGINYVNSIQLHYSHYK